MFGMPSKKANVDQKLIQKILGSTVHPVSPGGPLQTYFDMKSEYKSKKANKAKEGDKKDA